MDNPEPSELQRALCSFLKKPFPECYCMHMSSMNIPKILEFCAGDFTLCRIYRHHAHLLPSPQGPLCLQNM